MPVSFNGATLADDTAPITGHTGLEVSAVDMVQQEAVIGAAGAFYQGRGNSLYTVSFSARRVHATVAAAVSYCGETATATRGTAAFSGFGISLAAATCQARVRHESGVVTLGTYVITGTTLDP